MVNIVVPLSVALSWEICNTVSESYVTYTHYSSEAGTEYGYHTPNSDLEVSITTSKFW